MAELVLKINAGSGYEDGDVLCAFNRRRIRCCHAQHICHVRKAPRNGSGLILRGSLSQHWFEATHQYRFERVAADTLKRVTIATGAEELLGSKPNERGEQIDVRLFLTRRKRKTQHYLFGEDGAEVWYGGQVDLSHAKLDRVWTAIETHSPLREKDHALWPAGSQDLRSHLFLPTDDLTDDEVIDLESPEVEGETLLQKRKHKIDWEERLALPSAQRIRDRNELIDLRQSLQPLVRATIVTRKPSLAKGR